MNRADPDSKACLTQARSRTGLYSELWESCATLSAVDLLVYLLIIALGAFHFFTTVQAVDFSTDDVLFGDTARSIVEHGFYGINGYAETNLPPGLSLIFAVLCAWGWCSRIAFVRTMVVCGTLGFLASYELLRRQMPRAVAAAICLLLLSSQAYFLFVTRLLYPSFPLFFTTVSALLVARKLDETKTPALRIAWGLLLGALVVVSLMMMSVAVALLGALIATVCGGFLRDRRLAFQRLKIYALVLILGVTAEGVWMHHSTPQASAGIAAEEWPIDGFPRSYLAQLKLKSGNYPELGSATPMDIVLRMFRHASEQSGALSEALLRQFMVLNSVSIFVFLPLSLIVFGWCWSLWQTGGDVQDWYFAGFAFIYLIWPWNFEPRFAIAPLACLYLWRGGNAVVALSRQNPRLTGATCFILGTVLAGCGWLWMHGSKIGRVNQELGPQNEISIQDEASFLSWVVLAIAGALMFWNRDWLRTRFQRFWQWLVRACRGSREDLMRAVRFGALAIVGVLFVAGLSTQLQIARANLDPVSEVNLPSADAEAAKWINVHTDEGAVIMARHVPIVFHFAKRKTIWFPPSSDPSLLLNGILQKNVDFLIVVHRKDSYYLPPDEKCFDQLVAAHPNNFNLTYQGTDFRIFRVIRRPV